MEQILKRPLCAASCVFLLSLYLCSLFTSDIKPAIAGALLLCTASVIVAARIAGNAPFKKARFISVIILVPLSLALVLSFLSFDVYYRSNTSGFSGEHKVEMVVTEQVYDESYYSVYRVCLTSVDGEAVNIRATLTNDFSSAYRNGDHISMDASLTPSGAGSSLSERYELSRGFLLDVECANPDGIELIGKKNVFPYTYISSARAYIGHMLSSALDGEELALAKALTVGDSSSLSFGTKTSFGTIGISHTLAISGLHLGIIMASLTAVLSRLGVKRKLRLSVLIIVGLVYVCILGFKPSVFRAYLMFCGVIASEFSRRNRDTVTSLTFSVALICLISPFSIVDIGLHLSFFATLGITTAALPIVNKINEAVKFRPAAYIISAVTVSLSALAFTLPYEIFYFGRLPLLAPVANLIFIPLVTVIIYLLPLLLISYFVPFLSYPISFVYRIIAGATLGLADAAASVTGGFALDLSGGFAIYAGVCAIALSLICLAVFRRKRIAAIPVGAYTAAVIVITLATSLYSIGKTEAYFRTNGSSDAIVIRSSDRTAVIDNSYGGYSFLSSVMADSASVSDGSIDVLVLTHYHEYTVTSLSKLIEKYRISSLVLLCPEEEDTEAYDHVYTLSSIAAACGASCTIMNEGGVFALGGVDVTTELEKDGGSHTSVRWLINDGERTVLYVCPREFKKGIDSGPFDEIIIGSHGAQNVAIPSASFNDPKVRAIGDKLPIHNNP